MLIPGIVSVSFRGESPDTIVKETQKAGLRAIEWGGDIHVPAGNIDKAFAIADMTANMGLLTAAYGSYYRLGVNGSSPETFDTVSDTAKALKAPIIRIWAGSEGSADISFEKRKTLADEARIIAGKAAEKDIGIALECHMHTLTDNWKSSLDFIHEVSHPNLRMYWQPIQVLSEDCNLMSARRLAPYVDNIHVFHWDKSRRYPLADGRKIWQGYLDVFRKAWDNDGKTHALLLEFMHDDNLQSLGETAEELLSWIAGTAMD